ncbi:MAG: hypothetical protein M5U35_10175 [Roseovarius sp.]|nr:hypothetical protein [Roseovarius sp.]
MPRSSRRHARTSAASPAGATSTPVILQATASPVSAPASAAIATGSARPQRPVASASIGTIAPATAADSQTSTVWKLASCSALGMTVYSAATASAAVFPASSRAPRNTASTAPVSTTAASVRATLMKANQSVTPVAHPTSTPTISGASP